MNISSKNSFFLKTITILLVSTTHRVLPAVFRPHRPDDRGRDAGDVLSIEGNPRSAHKRSDKAAGRHAWVHPIHQCTVRHLQV